MLGQKYELKNFFSLAWCCAKLYNLIGNLIHQRSDIDDVIEYKIHFYDQRRMTAISEEMICALDPGPIRYTAGFFGHFSATTTNSELPDY